MVSVRMCVWEQYLYSDMAVHFKHNRSEMVAVLGPYEALPYYIHMAVLSLEDLYDDIFLECEFYSLYLSIEAIHVTGRGGP
jgi:hypothetical protein